MNYKNWRWMKVNEYNWIEFYILKFINLCQKKTFKPIIISNIKNSTVKTLSFDKGKKNCCVCCALVYTCVWLINCKISWKMFIVVVVYLYTTCICDRITCVTCKFSLYILSCPSYTCGWSLMRKERWAVFFMFSNYPPMCGMCLYNIV